MPFPEAKFPSSDFQVLDLRAKDGVGSGVSQKAIVVEKKETFFCKGPMHSQNNSIVRLLSVTDESAPKAGEEVVYGPLGPLLVYSNYCIYSALDREINTKFPIDVQIANPRRLYQYSNIVDIGKPKVAVKTYQGIASPEGFAAGSTRAVSNLILTDVLGIP